MSSATPPTFGVVVLSQGSRPEELRRALDSVLQQDGVRLDMVVVGNAWEPVGLPEGVKAVGLPENVGIPAGRNAGVGHVQGEYLFFLDDDAWLLDEDFLAQSAARMADDDTIGMIQPRIEDPESGNLPRRWIPRLRKGSPYHTSNVFSVVEMAVVMRRDVFDATPGWPASFFYAHEGIELAWQVWVAGKRTVYDGSLRAGHPVMDPRRHDEYFANNARNRIWLARRNLPWPVSWAYVANWTAVEMLRFRSDRSGMRAWWDGWRTGWTSSPWPSETRHPKMPWSAVLRMGRNGRLPVI